MIFKAKVSFLAFECVTAAMSPEIVLPHKGRSVQGEKNGYIETNQVELYLAGVSITPQCAAAAAISTGNIFGGKVDGAAENPHPITDPNGSRVF
jgi:hypothetical protein